MAGVGMKDIKRRIKSVESTMQITKAMELVASSKLRKAKEKVENSRPYFNTLYDTMRKISRSTKGLKSQFTVDRDTGKKGYIVVAGDRGLAGGYNSNVLKTAVSHMDNQKYPVIAVGKKSMDFFNKRGYPLHGKFSSGAESIDVAEIHQISEEAIALYKSGEIDELYIVFTKFVSTLTQEPQIIKLLPLKFDDEGAAAKSSLTVYEPSPEGVFDYLVPKYIDGIIFGAIVESFASEQGARRTAMESATDNAEDMIGSLQLKYNRARQATITQEISEIVAGAEALK
ncbi:ATP synthase F1 subunit gamma [Acetoanaerobium noterae]|jgi:F-type H+-transporting ATPase subunit gamma|uniref:ATP synthase F1 subunit gamma n=1 Tax=Acetoanaerobium noterae TaxID=745369 RepID=UPI001B6511DB|nr:ATP synthase F1 subunit gamma [Acetoanaerobium sp.]MBP9499745.1 ATP synthase F1 subunit gamma [Acetoanaerobium sp.]MBP9561885.1 ATP synthase F1 subunit gamma [Acetoanaerobium sp.]